jgi:hypothetical protein
VGVVATQNAASRAVVSVVSAQDAAGGARVSVAATGQDTASSAATVAATQNASSRAVVSVAAAATQNATCRRRVRRLRAYSGAESRLPSGVRGCVGGGAVVPSQADVAEDRGDYATFFVGCVVGVVEGVVVSVAGEAGGGVCRHVCVCCGRVCIV